MTKKEKLEYITLSFWKLENDGADFFITTDDSEEEGDVVVDKINNEEAANYIITLHNESIFYVKDDIDLEEDYITFLNGAVLDTKANTITKDGNLHSLFKKQYTLLKYLYKNQHKVVNRSLILKNIWGIASESTSKSLNVNIRELRILIGDCSIETYTGRGYKLNV
jgi:DNA-binding response OmpR family regulator